MPRLITDGDIILERFIANGKTREQTCAESGLKIGVLSRILNRDNSEVNYSTAHKIQAYFGTQAIKKKTSADTT